MKKMIWISLVALAVLAGGLAGCGSGVEFGVKKITLTGAGR